MKVESQDERESEVDGDAQGESEGACEGETSRAGGGGQRQVEVVLVECCGCQVGWGREGRAGGYRPPLLF